MPLQHSSLEFRLMLSLLRENLGGSALEGFGGGDFDPKLDWAEFERLLLEHRVLFPVWKELNRTGKVESLRQGCRHRLSELNKLLTLRQMKLTARLLEVVKRFDSEGIPYVTLKGPAFSQWLYGDSVRRHCNDLDILVAKEDFCLANRALVAGGYSSVLEPIDARARRGAEMWGLSHHKRYSGPGVSLELHWRLSSMDDLLPVSVKSAIDSAARVEIGGYPVSVLNRKLLVSYLTLHGSAHCWNRMKWAFDLASIRVSDAKSHELCGDCGGSLERAEAWREELLCSLFGFETGRLSNGALARYATRLSLRQLMDVDLGPGSKRNVLRRSVALFLMRPKIRSKLRYVKELLSWEPCYEWISLPEKLSFLYVLIGPVYWLYMRLLKLGDLKQPGG